MISALALAAAAGTLFAQAPATAHDTIFVATRTGASAQISAVANVVTALAFVVVVIVVAGIAWGVWRMQRRVKQLVERLHLDLTPAIEHVNAIADDVSFVTRTVREDVARINKTVTDANDRVEAAVAAAERRLHEFDALLGVVQEEAEDLFVSTASAVRGVRDGAAAFRFGGRLLRGRRRRRHAARRGMDLASDELDAANRADVIESQEEEDDGNDVTSGADAAPLPAAPRVRPRPRRARGE